MQSMTGCGNGQVLRDGWDVTVDLKTVNHRFLDVAMRLPRNIAFLEQPVRTRLAKHLRRGHVEVYLTVRKADTSSEEVHTDLDMARQYLEAARQIAAVTGLKNDLTVSRMMELEGVIRQEEIKPDQELLTAVCIDAVDIAAAQVKDMRKKEGQHLREDLKFHLDAIASLRTEVLRLAPNVTEDYRRRLNARLQELGHENADQQRISLEVALIADRCAIDEELARLESHIRQMRAYLDAKDEIGKKMDFLIQEMNRETNTIGSKANDVEIAQHVVEMKSEIEKMREQIQNVE